MALKADLCSSVMHAKLQQGKASGRFIHSAGSVQIFSNLSLKSNNDHAWMTTLPSLISLRNQKRNSNNKFRVLSMSSVEQATKVDKVPVQPPELEYDSDPPSNLYPSSDPYRATIHSVRKITGSKASGEVCHIVIDHGGNVPFWEGQFYGVTPPIDDPRRTGTAPKVTFFSLASTRYGDLYNGQTASLCVLRSGLPTSASNYLCDSKPGDEVLLSGPSGKTLLFPKDQQATDHIMVATSTGVAPFRGHLRRMFIEAIPNFEFTGQAWLIAGADNSDSLLYDDEFTNILNDYSGNFRYDKALSEEKTSVAKKIEENGDEIWERLDEGAYIYFSGSKTMMPGILDTFQSLANKRGVNWDEKLSKLKGNRQWRAEVY